MHRTGGAWSASRQILRPAWHVQTRSAVFPGRNVRRRRAKESAPDASKYPSFQISPMLLDLDAENSPYVRPAEKADADHQHRAWGRNKALEALAGRMDSFQDELAETDALLQSKADGLGPYGVLERDILSIAMFRAPDAKAIEFARSKAVVSGHIPLPENALESGLDPDVRPVLRQNGVPTRSLWDDASTIQYLRHARNQQLRRSLGAESSHALIAALRECKTLSGIRRLVMSALDREGGPKLVFDCGPQVADALRQLLDSPEAESHGQSREALKFLNNLSIRLTSNGVGIDRALCFLGLQLASQHLRLGAISRFLQLGLEKGYLDTTSADAEEAVSGVLSALLLSMSPDQPSHTSPSRTDLFGLLTGSSIVAESRQPSARAAIGGGSGYRAVYMNYILLLGECGGLRTLWHEWNGSTPHGSPSKHISPGNKDRIFAVALQRLKAHRRLLDSSAVEQPREDVTGVYESDVRLDLRTISDSEEQRRNRQLRFQAPTSDTDLASGGPRAMDVETDRHQFLNHAKLALSNPDASVALAQLQSLVSA